MVKLIPGQNRSMSVHKPVLVNTLSVDTLNKVQFKLEKAEPLTSQMLQMDQSNGEIWLKEGWEKFVKNGKKIGLCRLLRKITKRNNELAVKHLNSSTII